MTQMFRKVQAVVTKVTEYQCRFSHGTKFRRAFDVYGEDGTVTPCVTFGAFANCQPGDVVYIEKAKIKKIEEFRGAKTTVVTHCKAEQAVYPTVTRRPKHSAKIGGNVVRWGKHEDEVDGDPRRDRMMVIGNVYVGGEEGRWSVFFIDNYATTSNGTRYRGSGSMGGHDSIIDGRMIEIYRFNGEFATREEAEEMASIINSFESDTSRVHGRMGPCVFTYDVDEFWTKIYVGGHHSHGVDNVIHEDMDMPGSGVGVSRNAPCAIPEYGPMRDNWNDWRWNWETKIDTPEGRRFARTI